MVHQPYANSIIVDWQFLDSPMKLLHETHVFCNIRGLGDKIKCYRISIKMFKTCGRSFNDLIYIYIYIWMLYVTKLKEQM